MKDCCLFKVRILEKDQRYIKNAIFLFNEENECFLELENIDNNQIATISITSSSMLSENEKHLIMFDFGYYLVLHL